MINWRKRQNFLAHRWGTLNFKEEETTRPQFQGKHAPCHITNEMRICYPAWKRWLKYCISIPLIVVFTVSSLIGMLMMYANRDIILAQYYSDGEEKIFHFDWSIAVIGRIETISAVTLSREHLSDPNFWYIIAGFPVALGLAMPLLNFVFMQVSRALNDFENYRTETQYRNALIIKVIAFRFVAYFAALYYYAYVSIGIDKKIVENGILRVGTSLVIYLTVANWWTLFLTIYVPLLMLRWRLYRERLNVQNEVRSLQVMEMNYSTCVELSKEEANTIKMKLINRRILLEQAQSKIWEEMLLPDYDPFFDYVQAIINFAYVSCFSAVLPITPFLVLLNQLGNMRLNAYKICRGRRRPLAQKTGGVRFILCLTHLSALFSNHFSLNTRLVYGNTSYKL